MFSPSRSIPPKTSRGRTRPRSRLALGCAALVAGAGLAAVAGQPRSAPPGGWQALFNGQDLAAWKAYGKPADAPVGWVIEGNTLAWRKGAGDLATKELFGDFELELEWKISPNGNSGVMFGVDEKGAKPWHSGPEIQLLDDSGHKDGRNPLTSVGALYSLYPPAKHAAKPVGEWNALRVRLEQGHLQSWLNDTLMFDVQMGTADWNARVAKSKFAPFPQFAHVHPGRILLQNHNAPVWFRAIRIRRL